jgi:hypothetical protein
MAMSFPDDLWLVGYHTQIVDASGTPMPVELQCHTFIGTGLPSHHSREVVEGIFSDGYTPGLDLPPGFGIPVKAGEKLLWTPMFNNRTMDQVRAAMKIELTVVRAHEAPEGLKPLRTTFRSVQDQADLYMVPPGGDIRSRTFLLPFVGKIHVMGTHIHPYGVSIELVNLTRGESVWKAVGQRAADGKLVRMPVYTNVNGYSVEPGDRFKLTAVYENPTKHPVDAMAGIFVLYAPTGSETAGTH